MARTSFYVSGMVAWLVALLCQLAPPASKHTRLPETKDSRLEFKIFEFHLFEHWVVGGGLTCPVKPQYTYCKCARSFHGVKICSAFLLLPLTCIFISHAYFFEFLSLTSSKQTMCFCNYGAEDTMSHLKDTLDPHKLFQILQPPGQFCPKVIENTGIFVFS